MAKTPTKCSQKQRRCILAIWHNIKLSEDEESMWKNIEKIIKKDRKQFWNKEKQRYELNWLTSNEAYKITQGFMAQQGQNIARGTNVIIQSKSEFATPCVYCKTPIYWGVANMNERIPIEIINNEMKWHNCPKIPNRK